jgi:uncharacterized protein YndB with AHSA1/START domain
MASASRELLASPAEVWSFLAEPHNLAAWWPGVVAVEPDRRGFAVGARWGVERRGTEVGVLRLPSSGRVGAARPATLVIEGLVPERRWTWQLLPRSRVTRPVAVAIGLEPAGPGRTLLTVDLVSRRGLGSGDRRTAQAAADGLHALLQGAGA